MNIGGFVRGLFSTPKLVDNVFDKDRGLLTQVGGWIDEQSLSEQEKKQMQADLNNSVQAFAVATLGESSERSQTRRKLATEWYLFHLFMLRLTVGVFFVDRLIISLSDETENTLSSWMLDFVFNPWICGITGGIGVFFWGSHAIRGSKWAKEEK